MSRSRTVTGYEQGKSKAGARKWQEWSRGSRAVEGAGAGAREWVGSGAALILWAISAPGAG